MKPRTWLVGPGVAVVALLSLAACGSSSSSTAIAPAASAAASASGPAGAPILVGSICSCSGAQASTLAKAGAVSTAWADSLNAAGGLNGHAIKMIVKDDASDPAKALQAAKDLVESEHVVAIVGDGSLADQAFASYVQGKGIPVVGGISLELPFLTNPDFFASGSSIPVITVGVAAEAKRAAKTKLGVIYCAESPVCAQLDPVAKGAAALSGLGYTSAKVSATAPNFTAPCLAMKSAGVDALFLADAAAVNQRIAASCSQAGYKPLLVGQISTYASTLATDANFDGSTFVSPNAPYNERSVPANQAMRTAFEKYIPGTSSADDVPPIAATGWYAGQLFEAASKAAGGFSPTSTPADITKGLYALKGETLGGLSGPLTFTQGKPAFPTCYFTNTISGGKLADPQGPAPVCLTAEQATALQGALASLTG